MVFANVPGSETSSHTLESLKTVMLALDTDAAAAHFDTNPSAPFRVCNCVDVETFHQFTADPKLKLPVALRFLEVVNGGLILSTGRPLDMNRLPVSFWGLSWKILEISMLSKRLDRLPPDRN